MLNWYSLILLSYFFFVMLHGPLMCVYFRKARMYKKRASCLVLCLCSCTSCPHLRTSPIWCYKSTKDLFSVCSRLCHSNLTEWEATRHWRLRTPWPLTRTSSGCVLVCEEHSSYSCPASVCLLAPLMHADKAHTPDASIPIQRHAWMLCIPIHTLRNKPLPEDKLYTLDNIMLTIDFMLYSFKTCQSGKCLSYTVCAK